MIDTMTHAFPILLNLSPLTLCGIGVVALSSLLYLFRPMPEFLVIMVTGLLYAAVPLLR